MRFTSFNQSCVLDSEHALASAENLLADVFPALGREPGAPCSKAEPFRRTRPDTHPLEGSVDATPESTSEGTAVELLPTGDVTGFVGFGPDGSAAEPGSLERTQPDSNRVNRPGMIPPTRDETINSRTIRLSHQRTWMSAMDHAGDSEPFHGGTKGTGTFHSFVDQMSVLVGCVDEMVAVGGSADVSSGQANEDDQANSRILGSARSRPLFPACRVLRALPGAGPEHDSSSWQKTPERGFSTRVGAVHSGWCDVSSTNQDEPSDDSSDLKAMTGDNSFLAPGRDLPSMLLEDDIDGTTNRRTSFLGCLRVSIVPVRKSTRTSRFDTAIRIQVSTEHSIHGSRDHRDIKTPDSVMLVDSTPRDGGDPDGSLSVGGAGFSCSFLSGRC